MLVHGFYHLMGYDHIQEEDKVVMRAKEEKVLEKLATHSKFKDTRIEATNKVKDSATIKKIASNDNNWEVRHAAVMKISSINELRNLQKKETNEYVLRLIDDKIKRITDKK